MSTPTSTGKAEPVTETTQQRDDLAAALDGFWLTIAGEGRQVHGQIANPDEVADVLHATLSRIAAERRPDMAAVLPSPADHLEMPHRMIGRKIVRTCSCGKPWPCDQARWNRLREHIRAERAAQDQLAAEHAGYGREFRSSRAYGAVAALDRLMTVMDEMEAGR